MKITHSFTLGKTTYLFEKNPKTGNSFKSFERRLRAILLHADEVGLQDGRAYLIIGCAKSFNFTYRGMEEEKAVSVAAE